MSTNCNIFIFSEDNVFNERLKKGWDKNVNQIDIIDNYDLLLKKLNNINYSSILLLKGNNNYKKLFLNLVKSYPFLSVIVLLDSKSEKLDNDYLSINLLQVLYLPLEIEILQKIVSRNLYYLELQELFDNLNYDNKMSILSLEGFYNNAITQIVLNPKISYDIFLVSINGFDDIVLSSTFLEQKEFVKRFVSILKEIAKRYKGIVANTFKENFLLLLPTQSRCNVFNRFSLLLKEKFILQNLKVNIGIKEVNLEKLNLRDDLEKVDYALRECKLKNNIISNNIYFNVFSNSNLEKQDFNKQIIDSFIKGLKEDEFEIEFQPIYEIKNHEIILADAVLKWHHPLFGTLKAGEFIPIFEQKHHIALFDLYVVEKVCKILVEFQQNNIKVVPLSIKLSILDFEVEDFVDDLIKIVEKYHINPQFIELCLTEPKYPYNFEQLKKFVPKLQSFGFRLGIDGFIFSLANASVSGLISIDTLRINMFLEKYNSSFYERLTLIRVALAVSKELDFEVIIEGIENAQSLSDVSITSCKFGQGNFFSPPLKINKLIDLINI